MCRLCFRSRQAFVGMLLVNCLALLCLPATQGQTPAVPVDPVRPVLNLQGPAGYTFALGFAGTPNRIYAAGTGKTVDLWDLERNPGGTIRTAVMAESIRWPVSRGNVGLVNAVGFSAEGRWLAIAGASALGAAGDISLFDLEQNQFNSPLPQKRSIRDPADQTDRQAHLTEKIRGMRSLAASPDGAYLASSGADGQIWFWQSGRNRLVNAPIEGTQIQATQPAGALYWPVIFAGPTRIVFASAAPPGDAYYLQYYDASTRKTQLLHKTVHRRAVTALAATPDGQVIVSADMDGQIVVDKGGQRRIGRIFEVAVGDPRVAISAVAITADGRRIAVCGEADAGRSYVTILDTQTLSQLDVRTSQNGLGSAENQFRHNSIAFDPEGRQLLVNENEDLTLLVWQLTDGQGNWIDRPLSTTQPFEISGRGSIVRNAAFLSNRSSREQGYSFSITTKANGRQIFDASEGRLEDQEQPDERLQTAEKFAAGWKIKHSPPNKDAEQSIQLTQQPGTELLRTFDVDFTGRYMGVHAFLADDNGQTFAVAVATQRNDLIHVLGLSPGLPILRTFRGHGGEPIGLSCSADGRYLLSTSRDCTVRIWSLDRLEGSPVPTDQSIYGASLQETPTGVKVTEVASAGIARARGLRNGDLITKIRGTISADTPDEIFKLMLRGAPEPFFRELVVHFLRDGQERTAKFFPAWEQLLTFVFDRAGEWAVFTAEGYFNASRAGQNLFGWQLNRGRNQSVRFEKAAALQKEFEKPDVIRRVLQLGNVPDALAALNLPPDPEVIARIEELPEIHLSSPAALTPQPPGARIEIRATVRFTHVLKEDDLYLQAADNGRQLQEPVIERADDGSQATFTWGLVTGDQVHAVSIGYKERDQPVVDSLQSTRQLNFACTTIPTKDRGQIFLIGLAGSKYTSMSPLMYPAYDLDELQTRLKGLQYRESSNYEVNLKEAQITRKNVQDAILKTIKRVRERQNPNDLIVFIAAGHGDVYNGEFCYIPPDAEIISRQQDGALTTEQEINNYRVCIPWKLISGPLNEAPCHVLWVVDACHSGQAQTDSAHKAAIRESAGIHAMRQVLWSSLPEEESLESGDWQFESDQSGHGAFTLALLEALTGTVVFPARWNNELRQFDEGKLPQTPERQLRIDLYRQLKPQYEQAQKDVLNLRQDRQLDFAEIADYVTQRVKELVKDLNKRQTPSGFPKRIKPGISSAPLLILEVTSE